MSDTSSDFAALRQSLYSAVVADALDGLGLRDQCPDVSFGVRTLGDAVLVGRARTTLWADIFEEDPRPYELELRAVDDCRPDDVLVCATGGSLRSAIWGELLSTAARNRGCVGAIVDGAVRDIRAMRAMEFPVFARDARPADSRDRQRVIQIDVAVEIGGVVVRPGDLVVADEDGVVFVPRHAEEQALARALEKVGTENRIRAAIRDGMPATEAFRRFGTL